MKNEKLVFSKRNHWVKSEKVSGLLFIGNTSSFIRVNEEQERLLKNKEYEKIDKELYENLENIGAFVSSDESVLEKYKLFSVKNNNYWLMEYWINFAVSSGPRTTGDGYYESCIVGLEENFIEITE